MNSFSLVNPCIQSDKLQTTYEAKKPMEAANKFYNDISKYFLSPVKNFKFTIKSNNGEYYHYEAKEEFSNDNIKFVIKAYNGNIIEKNLKNMKKLFKKQVGGKHKHHRRRDDDSSSSSSSDSDDYLYRRVSFPINSWWYNPFVYLVDSELVVLPSVLANTVYVPGLNYIVLGQDNKAKSTTP